MVTEQTPSVMLNDYQNPYVTRRKPRPPWDGKSIFLYCTKTLPLFKLERITAGWRGSIGSLAEPTHILYVSLLSKNYELIWISSNNIKSTREKKYIIPSFESKQCSDLLGHSPLGGVINIETDRTITNIKILLKKFKNRISFIR